MPDAFILTDTNHNIYPTWHKHVRRTFYVAIFVCTLILIVIYGFRRRTFSFYWVIVGVGLVLLLFLAYSTIVYVYFKKKPPPLILPRASTRSSESSLHYPTFANYRFSQHGGEISRHMSEQLHSIASSMPSSPVQPGPSDNLPTCSEEEECTQEFIDIPEVVYPPPSYNTTSSATPVGTFDHPPPYAGNRRSSSRFSFEFMLGRTSNGSRRSSASTTDNMESTERTRPAATTHPHPTSSSLQSPLSGSHTTLETEPTTSKQSPFQ